MIRLPQIFWTIVGLDALFFVVALVLVARQNVHDDGGKEMALFFFIFVPLLVLAIAALVFHFSSSMVPRLIALFIVTVPALYYAKLQVEDMLIDRRIEAKRTGVYYFKGDAMRAMGAAVVTRDVDTLTRIGRTVDVNTIGEDGVTLLSLAVDDDHSRTPGRHEGDELPVVKALLALGAKPDQGMDAATKRDTPELLTLLLDAGGNPNMLAANGQPVVFSWKSVLKPGNLRALAAHGLDLNSRWYEDPMPVVFTIGQRWDLLAVLVELGADMSQPRPDGRNVAGELQSQIDEAMKESNPVPPELLRAKALVDGALKARPNEGSSKDADNKRTTSTEPTQRR